MGASPFEVIFIDDGHGFKGCLADFVSASPHWEEHGAMIFHDVTAPALGKYSELRKNIFPQVSHSLTPILAGLEFCGEEIAAVFLRWQNLAGVFSVLWRVYPAD